ncbi:SDR family oxidoreductase [Gordonia sp. NPDC003950]
MRVFVTGATGWIGSAVVPELISAGQEVVGLSRSDAGAQRLTEAGAQVVRGDLGDLDILEAAAADADGVLHLAFIHDFTRFAVSLRVELNVLSTFIEALEGSGRPLLFASGIPSLGDGTVATERDHTSANPRIELETQTLDAVNQGVGVVATRFAPTVHGVGDHGFIAHLIAVSAEHGVAAYVGDGENRWPAVHRSDVACMIRLALEKAPAGTVCQAVGEQGIPTRTIAEAIGRSLGVPTESVTAEEMTERAGFIGTMFGADLPASSTLTQELLGWTPIGPTLIQDIDAGAYADLSAST